MYVLNIHQLELGNTSLYACLIKRTQSVTLRCSLSLKLKAYQLKNRDVVSLKVTCVRISNCIGNSVGRSVGRSVLPFQWPRHQMYREFQFLAAVHDQMRMEATTYVHEAISQKRKLKIWRETENTKLTNRISQERLKWWERLVERFVKLVSLRQSWRRSASAEQGCRDRFS